MDHMLATALDRLRETQFEVKHLLQHMVGQQEDILTLLRHQQLKHRRAGKEFDWNKWAPKIWLTVVVLGLVMAKLLDLPEVAATLTKLP